jgi:predicted nucleic acid-binding Zn ribbon protein
MEPARSALHKIALDLLKQAGQAEAPLLAWALVCGSSVAERTRAAAFAAPVLTVEVPDAAWRAELKSLEPQYLAALRQMLGDRVTRIEFVIVGGSRKPQA